MRKIIIILFMFSLGMRAQSVFWPWVNSFGGSNTEVGYSIDKDQFGNLYVCGTFSSDSFAIGSITLYNSTISSNMADSYIAKFDPNGNALWAKSFGGPDTEFAYDLSVDASGNIAMSGAFDSPTISIETYTFSNAGPVTTRDMYLAKFDPTGNVIWAKTFGGTGEDHAFATNIDQSGNIIFGGQTTSPIIAMGTTTLTYSPLDGFLAKSDPNGNILWAINSPITLYRNIATDSKGKIYIGGYFSSSTMSVGPITFTNSSSTNSFSDLFLIKYDQYGNVIWGKSSTGVRSERIFAVKIDADNIYVVGNFNLNPTIGPFTFTSVGSDDAFILKSDTLGNFLWAKSITCNNWNNPYSLSVDGFGSLYIVGAYNGTLATSATTSVVGTGFYNGYVTKYDTSGIFSWATGYSGNNNAWASDVVAGVNKAYVLGHYNCTTPLAIGSNTITSNGDYDFYLGKITDIVTGITNMEKKETTLIYPNPNGGTFILMQESLIENGELFIFNSIGQKVFVQKIKQGDNEIKTQGLSKGLYHYSLLQNKTQIQTGKIMIE